MWFLSALLVIPLIAIFNWSLSLSNHWVQNASEQLRLDALSLSLCHSRKSFLESEIDEPNHEILKIRAQMNQLASQCLQNPLECEIAYPLIHSLAALSASIMVIQQASLASFSIRQQIRQSELVVENELEDENGNLDFKKLIQDGFSGLRLEVLSPIERHYESLFAAEWPRRWLAAQNFRDLNTYETQWRPRRSFHQNFKIQRRSVNEHGIARLQSQCRILRESEIWQVER